MYTHEDYFALLILSQLTKTKRICDLKPPFPHFNFHVHLQALLNENCRLHFLNEKRGCYFLFKKCLHIDVSFMITEIEKFNVNMDGTVICCCFQMAINANMVSISWNISWALVSNPLLLHIYAVLRPFFFVQIIGCEGFYQLLMPSKFQMVMLQLSCSYTSLFQMKNASTISCLKISCIWYGVWKIEAL